MATTRIIPLHASKGKTLKQALAASLNYGENPEKTQDGKLISSYQCNPATAAAEFALSKREYSQKTGRTQDHDVVAYQIRQSFKPGDITPEEANLIGYEFAERFTKGHHAFIVCTHTDKHHIHNHIYWNSTNLDCDRKFRDFRRSGKAVRQLSDLICVEHGLSIIENPQRHGKNYAAWIDENTDAAKPTNREWLCHDIDAALAKKPHSFEAFLRLMEEAEYTIRTGKHLAFLHPRQKKAIRLCSLGEGYSEGEIRLAISGQKAHRPRKNKRSLSFDQPQLVTKLEHKKNTGRGRGYDLKLTNAITKQQAKALLYFQQMGFCSVDDFAAFSEIVDQKKALVSELSSRIRSAEKRMKEISVLQTQIIQYAKTREAYIGYRKAGYSKRYFEEHEAEIKTHKAAKQYFDEIGVTKLPTVKSLRAEYEELLSQKKADYAKYYKAKEEYRTMLTYRANLAGVLGIEDTKNHERATQQHE